MQLVQSVTVDADAKNLVCCVCTWQQLSTATLLIVISVDVWMSTGSSCGVSVMDGGRASRREMSLKDWMSYYSCGNRGSSLLTMSVEFSRTKLEKCLELPEIVCSGFNMSIE